MWCDNWLNCPRMAVMWHLSSSISGTGIKWCVELDCTDNLIAEVNVPPGPFVFDLPFFQGIWRCLTEIKSWFLLSFLCLKTVTFINTERKIISGSNLAWSIIFLVWSVQLETTKVRRRCWLDFCRFLYLHSSPDAGSPPNTHTKPGMECMKYFTQVQFWWSPVEECYLPVFHIRTDMQPNPSCTKMKLSPKSNLGFICDCVWDKPLCKSVITRKRHF